MMFYSNNEPKGILIGSFEELQVAGCIQCKSNMHRAMFQGLMFVTNQNVCNGCPAYNNGKCEAFKKFHTGAPKLKAPQRQCSPSNTTTPGLNGLTVKQIAEQLGISINEVRRRKVAGTL